MIRAGIDIQRFADSVAALAEELAAPSRQRMTRSQQQRPTEEVSLTRERSN